jgi:hypothetical protein
MKLVTFLGAVVIAQSLNSALAANPFLDAPDDQPISATFRGTEWNDKFDEEDEQIRLTATVVTKRIATMPWGAIFQISFENLKSRAPEKREISPDYFIVTEDRIVLINEGDKVDEAVQKISTLEQAPTFDPWLVYGITQGRFSHEEGLWTTTIELKGDLCIYDAAHPSGHFKKIVWKKGIGLIEYSEGYGAGADGFRLKRLATKKP